LPRCVVPCHDLLKRVKANKAELCSLELDSDYNQLVVNGGMVRHTISTLDGKDFPVIPAKVTGQVIRLNGGEFKQALTTALIATATDPTRYAINDVLLEHNEKGTRLVATDGRRLVVAKLECVEGDFFGKVKLSQRLAKLICRWVASGAEETLSIAVKSHASTGRESEPSDVCVLGPGWQLFCKEPEGTFPHYQPVIPASSSKFSCDKRQFMDTLDEVALATNIDSKGVQLDLSADCVTFTAESPDSGRSCGAVPARFDGGGDDRIITGFNPDFLRDALKTLPGDRFVIDVEQNSPSATSESITGRPAMIYDEDNPKLRWILMPVRIALSPNRESLGSNYEHNGQTNQTSNESSVKTTPSTNDASTNDIAAPQRRSRRIERSWPEIGVRLEGAYEGETYVGLVIAAPKLKAGRALQVISGPACGRTFNSMTAAMLAATAGHRRKLGLAGSKKGLPKSGWEFWQEPQAKRQSA